MFYKGKIEKINKLVVSDPSYGKDVWCRYECDNAATGLPWNVQLSVNNVVNEYEGFTCKGVEFGLLLYTGNEKLCTLKQDGNSFSYPAFVKTKEFEIGMDTACVAMGINEHADDIIASHGDWQPGCALKTLTDGMFGSVYEGTCYGKTHLMYISGYLDEDTGYSVEDIVQYLTSSFEIKDLELVKDVPALEDKIADANGKKESMGKSVSEKETDLEI